MKTILLSLAIVILLIAPTSAETWPISITDFVTGQIVYIGEQDLTVSGANFQRMFKEAVDPMILMIFGEQIPWWPPALDSNVLVGLVRSTAFYQLPLDEFPGPFPPPFDE